MRTSRLSLLAAALALGAVWVTSAIAAEKANGPMRGFRGMRGHPGGFMAGGGMGQVDRLLHRLERLEADTPPVQFSLERFPDADSDGNGELSDTEWAAFAASAREKLLARLVTIAPETDANEDGVISEAELEALKATRDAEHRAKLLERHPEADLDSDGTLSDAELEAFKAAREAEHRARILERNPEADTDNDGVLSDAEFEAFGTAREAEHRARILERHPEADLDGDGVLSDEEMEDLAPRPHAKARKEGNGQGLRAGSASPRAKR